MSCSQEEPLQTLEGSKEDICNNNIPSSCQYHPKSVFVNQKKKHPLSSICAIHQKNLMTTKFARSCIPWGHKAKPTTTRELVTTLENTLEITPHLCSHSARDDTMWTSFHMWYKKNALKKCFYTTTFQ